MQQVCQSRFCFRRAGIVFCCLALLVSGCASGKLKQARSDFYSGRLDQASEVLSSPDDVSGRDRLLYYMEKGVILHYSGEYQQSIQILLQATKLMEEQDMINTAQQVESLVTNEWVTAYKGEYAERLLVHTYLMMDYLIVGQYDDALVEGKQALKVYDRYPEACNGDYFTRALIAQCFEAVGEKNDAYIEYKKVAELLPDPAPIAGKLYSLGKQLGFDNEVEPYRKYVPDNEKDVKPVQDSAEVILFVGQGHAPVKIPQNIVLPPSIRFSFCTYSDGSRYFDPPRIGMSSETGDIDMITTDVGDVLRASLKDRLAQIIIKETARAAAKEIISEKMKDPLVELLVRVAFLIMEEPDTRCWQTLPAYMTLVCIPAAPGQHQLKVNAYDGQAGYASLPDINVIPGRKYYFYSIRE